MDQRNQCRGCGASRPSDAPSGLCPACLLKAGLIGQGSEVPDVTITFGPASSSVLARFGEAFGKIPQVLLRDTDSVTDPSPVIRPSSPEIPGFHDRSARLQLFGEIARGGMGAVLKGRDSDLGRDLAVKVLLEAHRDNPDLIRRFVEEAQIAGQLQHPGIVPIYELGAFGDQRPYFAMKLVKGRTLADMLGSRKDPVDDLPRFLGIFEQIAQTVAYAHARGVIHRDLKPSNVMVGSFGEVQVMDWGLAKVLPRGGATDDASAGKVEVHETVIATARSGSDDTDLSRAGSVMGTPSYMAPEQARGEIDQIDERADVFALGSILAEILTGQPAFTGRNSGEIQRKAARGDLAEASTRLESSQADPALIALTLKCLAPEADDRPRNAGEVAARVEAYLSGVQERLRSSEIDRARAEAKAAEEHKRVRLVVALAAAIVGLVALGGGGAAWITKQRQARITAVEKTLARIETLRDQAETEGPESTRRREALAAADQAIASIGDFETTDLGRKLTQLRLLIATDEERARFDQTFIKELAWHQTNLARNDYGEHDSEKINQNFADVFIRYKMDLDSIPIDEAINRLKGHPAAFVQEVVGVVDQWLVFLYGINEEPAKTASLRRMKRLLELARGLDPEPQRNVLRALLEQPDLKIHKQELATLEREPKIYELGPSTPLLLARSLILAEDQTTALAVLRKSVLRYPDHLWTNLELAQLLGRLKPPQWDESIRYYTAVRSIQPQAGWNLIPALINQNRNDEAEKVLDELARSGSLSLKFLTNLSHTASADGSGTLIAQRMVSHLRASLVNNPDAATVHWRTAAILLSRTDDIEGAIAEYREAARLDPKNDGCRYELAIALARRDPKGAAKILREAIQISPNDPLYHEGLAHLLRTTGDPRGEIEELREAIRCVALRKTKGSTTGHQRGSDLFENEGCLGSHVGDIIGITESFAFDYYGEKPGLYTKLGGALAEFGDTAGGILACEDGLRLEKATGKTLPADLFVLLGNLQRKAGNLPDAITNYREAIKLNPAKALDARYGLSVALAESTDQIGAAKELLEARRIDKSEFALFHAVMLAKQPEVAIAALRQVHDLPGDDRVIRDTIDRMIHQFEIINTAGVRIPTLFREIDQGNLASICYDRRYFSASAALWAAALKPNRYDAACSAALAGCGKGNDPPQDEIARARLRAQALDWLKADLVANSKLLDAPPPAGGQDILRTMQHWKKDTDLAGIRDPEPLAKLPEAERKEWQALWAEVDALIVKAGASKASP